MTEPNYLHLVPGQPLPCLDCARPFKVVLVIEANVTPEWQEMVSDWLVRAGCLWMMAWGRNCSAWDDSVDLANMRSSAFGQIPEDKFVMTRWHDKEALNEVFWFSRFAAVHPTLVLEDTFILHIAATERSTELVRLYLDSQNG